MYTCIVMNFCFGSLWCNRGTDIKVVLTTTGNIEGSILFLFYDNFLWSTNFTYYRALWNKSGNGLSLNIASCLLLLTSFLDLVVLFLISLGALTYTLYKCSTKFTKTKNKKQKNNCYFEPLHCLVCQILHQSCPDKRSQENMPF